MNVVLAPRNLDRVDELIALAERLRRRPARARQHAVPRLGARRTARALLPTREQLERARAVAARRGARLRGRDGGPVRAARLLRRASQGLHGRLGPPLHRRRARRPRAAVPRRAHAARARVRQRAATGRSPRSGTTPPAFSAFRGEAWMPEPCRSCDRRDDRLRRLPLPGVPSRPATPPPPTPPARCLPTMARLRRPARRAGARVRPARVSRSGPGSALTRRPGPVSIRSRVTERESLPIPRLALAFATMLFVSGIGNMFPVFFPPLLEEFGGSRTATALAVTLIWAAAPCSRPWPDTSSIAGAHARSSPSACCATAAGSRWPRWHRRSGCSPSALGIGVGVGIGLTGMVTQAAVIAADYRRRRGLATGIAFAGSMAGYVMATPAHWVITASAGGRRWAPMWPRSAADSVRLARVPAARRRTCRRRRRPRRRSARSPPARLLGARPAVHDRPARRPPRHPAARRLFREHLAFPPGRPRSCC